MTKNTSIVLIALIAAVMIAGALAVTVTPKAFAYNTHGQQSHHFAQYGNNGVNPPGHNACDNAGPAAHNPNCQ